jgi:hypothetical protein
MPVARNNVLLRRHKLRAAGCYAAAPTTVEAIMYALRTYGSNALKTGHNAARLAELSDKQLSDVIARLEKLRATYPAIDNHLLELLKGLS